MKRKLMSIFAVALAAGFVYATAATGPVNTPARTGLKSSFGVYANVIIYAGSIVALNSSGYAVPAANASGYAVVGRASKTIDNRVNNPTVASGASNAQKIEVERGVFGFATDNITVTSVGSVIYVLDDSTVTTTAGSYATIAGILVDYSGGYAWVDTFNIPRAAGTFTTLSSSGAASLNSVGVTGNAIIGGAITSATLSVTGAIVGDSTLDVDSVTVDAGGVGVTVQSAGELALGKTTATSVTLGSAAVTAITLATDGTGDSEVVLPLLSIGNGEINDLAVSKLTGGSNAVVTFASTLQTNVLYFNAGGCLTNQTHTP